jgi:hypothetical protein
MKNIKIQTKLLLNFIVIIIIIINVFKNGLIKIHQNQIARFVKEISENIQFIKYMIHYIIAELTFKKVI